MKKIAVLLIAILSLVLSACGVLAPNQASRSAYPTAAAPSYDYNSSEGGQGVSQPPAAPGKTTDNFGTGSNSSNGDIAAAQQRLIVQNVDLSIVVSDVQKKMDEINAMASTMGGYLVSMSVNQQTVGEEDIAAQGSISIRVPASKLEDALKQIKAATVDVPSEKRTGQDVTSQYIDLQSQLNNLQQAEKDLQDIMDEAKNNPGNDATTKTQDVLNVYAQIVSIRGQIEQIQGQMKYIEETTSTSAINVSLIAEQTVQPIVTGRWKPLVTISESAQGLVKFLQGFVDFLIILVIRILPALIIIFGPIALVVWAIVAGFKRRKARKAKAA